MAPFNHIVLWTWPLLGLATVLYSLGLAAQTTAATTVYLASAYALSSGTFASNICAGALFANGEPASFAVCDVTGAAVGAAVEGLQIHCAFTAEEWNFVRGLPGEMGTLAVKAFKESVRTTREYLAW